MITIAYVNLWNKRVGAVAWNQDSEIGTFEFEPSFLQTGLDLAPLKMSISTANKQVFSFPELRRSTTFKGLPGLLADVLPDKYGSSLINAWLVRNDRPTNSMNPVETLCFIGKRGMGALEFEPVVPKTTNSATKIEISSLIQIAQDILTGRQEFSTSLTADETKALTDVIKIGSSAGGARAKAVVAFNEITRELRSGQADAPKDFTHWLLKFDGVTDLELGVSSGYGRVEMAYHLMAKDAGIDMMECRLLEEKGRAHFMTKRFDREAGKGKLHVQTFCAIAHYDFNEVLSFSYEQLFETMRTMLLPYPEAEQLFRRMVFNVMGRNCDDHTKNFAFLMDKKGKWTLAPAYDVCYAFRPGSAWVSQHALSVNGKRKDIMREDLLEAAKKMNIKKPGSIIDQVRDAIALWETYAKQTDVEQNLKKVIGKNLLLL
jgi:serine/threonine-protein kinase HipA